MLMYVRYIICIYLVAIVFMISSCSYKKQEYEYYSQQSNYVCATGTVTLIEYSDRGDALYILFENLYPQFSGKQFEIVGDNLTIVQKNGIDAKLEVGKEVEFISATRYFGDGYVMPIVGITVDGEVLLEFDEGYENLIKWLE